MLVQLYVNSYQKYFYILALSNTFNLHFWDTIRFLYGHDHVKLRPFQWAILNHDKSHFFITERETKENGRSLLQVKFKAFKLELENAHHFWGSHSIKTPVIQKPKI